METSSLQALHRGLLQPLQFLRDQLAAVAPGRVKRRGPRAAAGNGRVVPGAVAVLATGAGCGGKSPWKTANWWSSKRFFSGSSSNSRQLNTWRSWKMINICRNWPNLVYIFVKPVSEAVKLDPLPHGCVGKHHFHQQNILKWFAFLTAIKLMTSVVHIWVITKCQILSHDIDCTLG